MKPPVAHSWQMPLLDAPPAPAEARRYEAEQRALHIHKDMRPVPYETPLNTTEKAVLFPTHGWVPKTSLRWETVSGWTAAWSDGSAARGDKLTMEYRFINRSGRGMA